MFSSIFLECFSRSLHHSAASLLQSSVQMSPSHTGFTPPAVLCLLSLVLLLLFHTLVIMASYLFIYSLLSVSSL